MSELLIESLHHKLFNAQRILIVSHIHPDGDAIGSMLGLGLALQEVDKEVQMVVVDGIPAGFRHLVGSEKIVSNPSGSFDLVVVLDCSDLARTGEILNLGNQRYDIPDVNIDHHMTNLRFARVNLVEENAVATAQILACNLPRMGLPITQPVASALLNGIITDSLGFRTTNMTPEAMRISATLMEAGANLPELYRRALFERTYEAARYWGMGLSKLQRDNSLVWATLTTADRKAVEYPGRDDADLINILATIRDAEIVLVFIEQNHRRVKVSWRSQPGYDVSQIALRFGGGGHMAASGVELDGTLEEVQEKVLQATRVLLNG